MQHAVSAVLFDLDNTLADRDEAFKGWARQFACDQLGFAEPDRIEDVVSALVVLDAAGYTPRDTLFRSIAERYGVLIDDVDVKIRAYREQLIEHLPPLDPAAAGLLTALDQAGMPWGIVSNGSSLSQRGKIRKLDLERRSTCVVVSEESSLRKPDPRIFRAAAGILGILESEILFVGDHPHLDVAGAARVGMRTAWLRRGRSWPADLASFFPDLTVDSLTELLWVADGSGGPTHQSAGTTCNHDVPLLP